MTNSTLLNELAERLPALSEIQAERLRRKAEIERRHVERNADEIREKYADYLLAHLEQLTGESVKDRVVVQRVYSQRDFSKDYHAFKGTALGLAHTMMQTAIFRPSPKSKKLDNLYYAGQYTHPGVGVAMTLIAGTVVDQIVAQDHGVER